MRHIAIDLGLGSDIIGNICFDNVTFRYDSRKFVFDDFSLTIQKGKVDVIKNLGLEKLIDELPQGLNTHIGEHGTSLSGGERQRLTIARAVYRNPDIILFDEATSSLDTLAEKYVKQVFSPSVLNSGT